MAERKMKLSWADLQEHLQKREVILSTEEIREITLIKPKEMLLYLKGRRNVS